MIPLWADWLFNILGITLLLSLISGAVVAWYRLNQRVDGLESHLGRIEYGIDEMGMYLLGKNKGH